MHIYSFGIKHLPVEQFKDEYEPFIVVDSRGFSNPYKNPELKHLTGVNSEVFNYVFQGTHNLQLYLNKRYEVMQELKGLSGIDLQECVIGFYCIGGKHRSVAFARQIANHIRHSLHVVPKVTHLHIK